MWDPITATAASERCWFILNMHFNVKWNIPMCMYPPYSEYHFNLNMDILSTTISSIYVNVVCFKVETKMALWK